MRSVIKPLGAITMSPASAGDIDRRGKKRNEFNSAKRFDGGTDGANADSLLRRRRHDPGSG